jgi:hypothetical protein
MTARGPYPGARGERSGYSEAPHQIGGTRILSELTMPAAGVSCPITQALLALGACPGLGSLGGRAPPHQTGALRACTTSHRQPTMP